MDIEFLPLLLVLMASFFQGTFGLGIKYIAPLSWEAWWLLFSFISMILLPFVCASLVIPDVFEVIINSSTSTLTLVFLFGVLWGIGSILFGISVKKIGISITYGIVMGLVAAVGSIIPYFQIEGATSQPMFPIVLTGVVLLLLGVAITTFAGVEREKNKTIYMPKNNSFKKGALIAIASGILSAFINIGFSKATPIIDLAVEKFGINTQNASLLPWIVILLGGFMVNSAYALFLLTKNNSWNTYISSESSKSYRWVITSSIFWFAAHGIYGLGVTLMGNMGSVIGWPILIGFSLVISNIWAFQNSEWEFRSKSFNLLLFGLAVIIIAICSLGYANS